MAVSSSSAIDPSDTPRRLAELGLTPEHLREAVTHGDSFRLSCTSLDPATFPGLLQWGKTIRRLREVLVPDGWRASREGGLETVVREDESVAITVGTGDEATGHPDREPQSKYPKGPSTILAVLQNNGQRLFSFMGRQLRAETGASCDTWILLIHSTGDEIRYELSRPKAVDRERYRVVAWFERIILPPILRDGPATGPRADDEDDFDVDVRRRAQ